MFLCDGVRPKDRPLQCPLSACVSLLHRRLRGRREKKLVGKGSFESGDGALRTVTLLEFKDSGEFTREVTIGGQVLSQALDGKWRLTAEATGVKAVFADSNKLILTYKKMQPLTLASGIQMDLPVNKTEVWLVIISKDATFGGKETRRLAPIGEARQGTNYYFRAPWQRDQRRFPPSPSTVSSVSLPLNR